MLQDKIAFRLIQSQDLASRKKKIDTIYHHFVLISLTNVCKQLQIIENINIDFKRIKNKCITRHRTPIFLFSFDYLRECLVIWAILQMQPKFSFKQLQKALPSFIFSTFKTFLEKIQIYLGVISLTTLCCNIQWNIGDVTM